MPRSIPNDTYRLTLDRLRKALSYDPDTGVFIALEPGPARGGGGRRIAGQVAGSLKASGYVAINLDGVRYRAHRLAWLYMTGVAAPDWMQIDHINGNRSDNRFANLRLADQTQNSANMIRPSALGVKGVSRYENLSTGTVRYRAHIMVGGQGIYLGSFKTRGEASEAYRKAAVEHFGEFARAA